MLQSIRIQNYKSLRDVTLHLRDVNLLIGPNNSGKSNVFSALEFLGRYFNEEAPTQKDLERLSYMQQDVWESPIAFTVAFKDKKDNNIVYRLEILKSGTNPSRDLHYKEFIGKAKGTTELKLDLTNLKKLIHYFSYYRIRYVRHSAGMDKTFLARVQTLIKTPLTYHFYYDETKPESAIPTEFLDKGYPFSRIIPLDGYSLSPFRFFDAYTEYEFITDIEEAWGDTLKNYLKTRTYYIDPFSLKKPAKLTSDTFVKGDASNLVSFLDNLQNNNRKTYQTIERDLKKCISEFEFIGTPTITTKEPTKKKILLTATNGLNYWADEISDGTLYFLALLCIIHQPDPPKILLLEEPEMGIHPRRIQEVMDFIFQLVDEKGIQIVLTTHSTQVVDEFRDIPENIFVVDKPKNETTIKNLQTDIINDYNNKSAKMNLPKIDLSGSLGAHWASGLLEGIPK